MMTYKITIYSFIVFALPAIQCISVVGPKVLRPFSSYTVAIAGGSRAYTLYVAVEGRRATGEQFNQGREVQVPAAASRHIELDIGDPGPGQYSLVARSTSGPLFSSSAPLTYQPRSFCVFVQTDKRVYQPSDTINFRIVALDKYLLPLTDNVDISILDAGGSPVRQWAGVALDRGIISDELVLADEPGLGEWTIQVEVRGQTYSRTVLVADYVLPKFHMEMTMPKELLFSDGRFNINVTAKHFNGLPVRGELTFSAYAVFFSGLLQPVASSPTRKVVNINGHAEVTYDLKTDLDLAEDAARPLVVEAVLEEKDTLIRQNVSARILLLRTPYRLRVTAPDYFKPTLPYVVQIEVVQPSGEPLETDEEVSVERLWDDGAPVNITTLKLDRGRAVYTVVPDAAHVNSTLNLQIKYKEVSERVVNVQRSDYSSGSFLSLQLVAATAADELRVRISATEPMDLVHYVVIARGDILLAKTLELSPARRSVDVSAEASWRLSPGCVVLAWHPRLLPARNQLLAAALYVPRHHLLQHQVSISPVATNGINLKPNSLVEVRVTGEPGSHVALLQQDLNAIDTGLASHDGRGDGLSLHKVEREVESFSGLKHSVFKNEDDVPSLGIDLGGYTAADVFKNAGVVILTDGVVIKNTEEGGSRDSELETGTRAPLAGPYAFSRLPPPPAPRYYLAAAPPATSSLANFTVRSDGVGSKEIWTPATTGDYTIGAFAVHPTMGLGLAVPQKFSTSVPLSMTAELPTTLQKGETVAAIVILKTTLAVDTTVEVTFYNSDQYFEFEPLDNDIDAAKKIELFRRESVVVPARGSASTAFLVTAVRTGDAPVIVEASGNGLADSLFRTIQVKDGYEEDLFAWGLLDARRGVARANVSLWVGRGVRAGAVSLAAAGELVAGGLRAARAPPVPAADPPHALRPLALACVLLDYLQATQQEDVSITKEARALASVGYQRLMAYRRSDGSFAAETDTDVEGDVWMTSQAVQWVSRCARHVQVSPGAGASLRWLAGRQRPDGSWAPPPDNPPRNDPRAADALTVTSHALLALLYAKGSLAQYKSATQLAAQYISSHAGAAPSAYSLAVACAALAAHNDPAYLTLLTDLDKYTNTSGPGVFWSRQLSGQEWRNPWLRGNSLDAQTAAWGLRCLMAARKHDEAVPVLKYLLQAYQPHDPDPELVDSLALFSQTVREAVKLRVSVNVSGSDDARHFHIGDNNALIIQTQLIRNSMSISAVTEGRGLALVGLAARGSTNVTAPWPRYTLDPRVDHVSTKDRLQLSICYGFVAQGNETESGLTLLTVQLPSGFLADINTITELTSLRHVSSARSVAGGAVVLAWLRAARPERCVTLAAPHALPTARQRPGWATLTDLYDTSHRARAFFQAVPSSACDVCAAWASCARACGSAAPQHAAAPNAPDQPAAAHAHTTPALTALTALALATLLLH